MFTLSFLFISPWIGLFLGSLAQGSGGLKTFCLCNKINADNFKHIGLCKKEQNHLHNEGWRDNAVKNLGSK